MGILSEGVRGDELVVLLGPPLSLRSLPSPSSLSFSLSTSPLSALAYFLSFQSSMKLLF